jgi:uncharacterized protein (TIGR00251 family)
VRLVVRVTPKGGRDGIDGLVAGADGRSMLAVRVSAAPSDGEANAAVVRLLAKALDLRPRDVEILAGQTARVKQVHLRGEAVAIVAKLEGLTE